MPTLTATAQSAYALYKKGKKARDLYKQVKSVIDEDTRSGALFKAGIKYSAEILGKLLGTSLTSHPYFAYHKAHIEILVQALNASSIQSAAIESLNKAISAADSANSLARCVDRLTQRRNLLNFTWYGKLAETIRLREARRRNPAGGRPGIAIAGITPAQLNAFVDAELEKWRAQWAELCNDGLALLGMVDTEYRVAEAAMERYNHKMETLNHGGGLGPVAAYTANLQRGLQMVDRMRPGSGKASMAVEDPAGYARRKVELVDGVAGPLAEACDVVMSDTVLSPNFMIQSLPKAG